MPSLGSDPVSSDSKVDAVRRFNRFYTQWIGILNQEYLGSGLSLTEVRVLYELAHRDALFATELGAELGLDAGYLSRILRRFERRGVIRKKSSVIDARRTHLLLTRSGRNCLAPLEEKARAQVNQLLGTIPEPKQREVLAAMRTIEAAFTSSPRDVPFLIRNHQPGDMGWVVSRHGDLYAREYGFDSRFEALVARIVANFMDHFDPSRERCWIAERDGESLGSVFLVKQSRAVAKLRLLLVEPKARGLGLGKRLVDECIRFAARVGYRRVLLWTQSNLDAARAIYRNAGFRIIGTEKHKQFGPSCLAETWELSLSNEIVARAPDQPVQHRAAPPTISRRAKKLVPSISR